MIMDLSTRTAQVLVVSDQQDSALLWVHCLAQRELQAAAVMLDTTPSQNLSLDKTELLVLDIQDDPMRALALCRYARATFAGPILLFTYECDERFHIQAYEAGVEECVAKPIGSALAVAKVNAWLRWTPRSLQHRPNGKLLDFQIDHRHRRLKTPADRVVKLSKLEFRLLSFLISHRRQILLPEQMMGQVWEGDTEMKLSRLKNLVYRLRKKMEPDPERPCYLRTIPGHGYFFDADLDGDFS